MNQQPNKRQVYITELPTIIFLNDFGSLDAEQRDVLLKWFSEKYPKHKVVFV